MVEVWYTEACFRRFIILSRGFLLADLKFCEYSRCCINEYSLLSVLNIMIECLVIPSPLLPILCIPLYQTLRTVPGSSSGYIGLGENPNVPAEACLAFLKSRKKMMKRFNLYLHFPRLDLVWLHLKTFEGGCMINFGTECLSPISFQPTGQS